MSGGLEAIPRDGERDEDEDLARFRTAWWQRLMADASTYELTRFAVLRLRYNLYRGGIDDSRVKEAEGRIDEARANYGKARNDTERDLRQIGHHHARGWNIGVSQHDDTNIVVYIPLHL